jgi:hypothetical protein
LLRAIDWISFFAGSERADFFAAAADLAGRAGIGRRGEGARVEASRVVAT